jgi:hypothetical protein
MKRNYIGLTGFKTPWQISHALETFFKLKLKSDHILMIGLLISPRNIDRDWQSARYPLFEAYDGLIESCHERSFTTLHIDSKNTIDWDKDLIQLCKHLDVDKIGGFQINVKHPRIDQLKNIKRVYDRKDIIMQYSNDFLDLSPNEAKVEFTPYAESIDHVLIDPSRGRGVELHNDKAIAHYTMLIENFSFNVGFAGGFSPSNITSHIRELRKSLKTNNFSTDVETGIRDDNDDLSLERMDEYLVNICKAFNE